MNSIARMDSTSARLVLHIYLPPEFEVPFPAGGLAVEYGEVVVVGKGWVFDAVFSGVAVVLDVVCSEDDKPAIKIQD
jgi:hypothetical protein